MSTDTAAGDTGNHQHDDFPMPDEPGEQYGAPNGTYVNGNRLGRLIAAGYDGCKPCQTSALDELAGDPLSVARLVGVAAATIEASAGGIPRSLHDAAAGRVSPAFATIMAAAIAVKSASGLYPAAASLTAEELRQAADDAADLVVGGITVAADAVEAAGAGEDWAADPADLAGIAAQEAGRHITATEHDGVPVWLLHVPHDAAERALDGEGIGRLFLRAGVHDVGTSWAAPNTHDVVHAFTEEAARQAFYALRAFEVPVTPRPDAAVLVRVQLLGLANGQGTPFDGAYLVEYDPTKPGSTDQPLGVILGAHVVISNDGAKARVLDVQEARHWVRQPSGRTRPDGQPDRPIKAFNLVLDRAGVPAPAAAVQVWVEGACGCVWQETRPASATIDPTEPRVCGTHRADHPASLYASPQGMAMVSVTYHAEDPRPAQGGTGA